MPTVNLTAQSIERLKRPDSGQVDYFDEKNPGFGLRISHGGKRAWILLYRKKGETRKRRLTLGQYPAMSLADAREALREHLVERDRGGDPASEKQALKQAPTFEDIAKEYLERHAKVEKRTWRKDELALEKDVLPAWGHRKAHDIRRRDVISLLDSIYERGSPIQANRTLALVRKVFNWAISRDLIEFNPCAQVKRVAAERQRDRVLSEDEIRAVWRAIEKESPMFSAMFKLRLLTAQRGGEIETMRWDDVDLDSGWWTIPGERAKNGRSHRVPLSAHSIALLRDQRARSAASPWVFPSRQRAAGHVVSSRHAADRIKTVSEVEFVPHDLRRTAASYMTGMGISRLVVSKILNHAEAGITRVYDRHSYDQEKREALDVWANRLMSIIAAQKRSSATSSTKKAPYAAK